VLRTLDFKSRLLLLKIFKVDVLEILQQLSLYARIDRTEINNTTKIKQIEQQIEEFL
jgi:tRNA(Ser,Leu) C12 N-acetylase TAN1